MDIKFSLKYSQIMQILNDVSSCAVQNLVLVGGTALALFYLKHRVSVDLDFVPLEGDEIKHKQLLKGCLTKKGYKTLPGRYNNQFVIQFEDTSIKMEVFTPTVKIKDIRYFKVLGTQLAVASLDDLLEQKIEAYKNRRHVRDIYDIIFILKNKNSSFDLIRKLLVTYGPPKSEEDIHDYIIDENNYLFFKKVMSDVS